MTEQLPEQLRDNGGIHACMVGGLEAGSINEMSRWPKLLKVIFRAASWVPLCSPLSRTRVVSRYLWTNETNEKWKAGLVFMSQ